MMKDENGQWMLLAGLIVSISIIALSLLLSQAMVTGHQSSQAVLEFPKHEIRELVLETHREVIIAANESWSITGRKTVTGNPVLDELNRTDVRSNFTIMLQNYTNSTEYLYAYHGQMINISIINISFYNNTGQANNISKVNVSILFDDGITNCMYRKEVIECY